MCETIERLYAPQLAAARAEGEAKGRAETHANVIKSFVSRGMNDDEIVSLASGFMKESEVREILQKVR